MELAEKRYEQWLAQQGLEPELRTELDAMQSDAEKITDAFYRDLEFGTAGLRGVLGAGTNRMNIYVIRRATQAVAQYLNETELPKTVAIGHDSRIKSDVFAREAAAVFAANGITGAVLKYRMPNHHPEVPLEDAVQALRIMAGLEAGATGYTADKVGIVGSSAGGHLAAMASTIGSFKPAFSVLFYPVITAVQGKRHQGSFINLLSEQRTPEQDATYSLENRVTEATPPTLLLLSDDDKTVPPVNSTLFYEALKRNGVKGCSLRIYPSGGHGGALDPAHIYRAQWRADILDWLAMLAHEDQKPTSKPR